MGKGALALLAAAMLLQGCSNRPGYALSQRPDDAPRVADRTYYRVLEDYTRYQSRYDGLDLRFFVASTWESWAFRQRRVAATADFLHLPTEEAERRLAVEREEALRYVDLFVGLHTPESRWNDLSSPDSIWRMELELPDGTRLEPISIERIGRPDANLQALYAYLTPFWVGYRIRFPGTDDAGAPLVGRDTEALRFRLTSSLGRVEPTWAVRPADVP